MSSLKSILIIIVLGLDNAVSAQVVQPTPAPAPARSAFSAGSAREAVDQGVFRATCALEGSPRWAKAVPLATSCADSLAMDAQAAF
jgi:hypothetical protein